MVDRRSWGAGSVLVVGGLKRCTPGTLPDGSAWTPAG